MTVWSATDLAYLAGIIDGEGTVGINRRRRSYGREHYHQVRVTVSNTEEQLIQWLHEMFGGKLIHPQTIDERHKRYSTWAIWGTEAQEVLEAVLPFLKLKARQAELVLAFLSTLKRQGDRLTDEEHEYREGLYHESLALNARGGQ